MIDQPSSVPIDAEILKAQEAARNNVTILEAESVRLDRLIGSQKRELIGQEGAKRDIEDQITLVEGKLAILEAQLESSEQSYADVIGQLNAANEFYTDTQKRTEALSRGLDEREAAVTERENSVTMAESDLKQREDAFTSVRDHHYAQIDRIKQAIQSL